MKMRSDNRQASDGSCTAAAQSVAIAVYRGWSGPVLAATIVGLMLSLGSCAFGPSAASSEAVRVDWRTLEGLDLLSGEVDPSLADVLGGPVRIPGYVVPLEDYERDVTEFLLVPSYGACIHVPPPMPNQMVYVVMEPGSSVDVNWWGFDPIWIEGVLEITGEDSPYGAVAFSMRGTGALTWGDALDADEV